MSRWIVGGGFLGPVVYFLMLGINETSPTQQKKDSMPKAPQYILVWSDEPRHYEIHTPGHVAQQFHQGETSLFSRWVETHTSFAFVGQKGRLSVRKEARPRGTGYWYASHKQGRRTRKRYLGRADQVTFARLEEVAQALNSEPSPAHMDDHPPLALAPISRTDVVYAARGETLPGSVRPDEYEATLLLTKFSHPRQPHILVPRERLLQTLDMALTHPLTLLSASAGWGKTTLLSTWANRARQAERSVAWLTLDEMDNDPTRFWACVLTALQTCLPALGKGALQLLSSPQPAPISNVLTMLINELQEQNGEVFLLLDDYQVIEEQAIQESLAFLLDHLPAPLHLILASRSDPDLRLARLRASGQVLEIRNRDFQLTPEEIDIFLAQTLGYALSEAEAALLYQRTEGWIAGVQLAALALRRQADPSAFLQAFTGSHRYLMDYVQHEILQRLPESIHWFLLQISVLPRMNAELCRAVTGEEASQRLLETLEQQNLFLIPLDEERCWYRLHDLFREVLLARLQASSPEHVQVLRARAARFSEQQGEMCQAVAFALAAQDFSFATRLMEQVIEELWLHGETQTLYRWMMALPDEVVPTHTRLLLTAAFYLQNLSGSPADPWHDRFPFQAEQLLRRVEIAMSSRAGPILPEDEQTFLLRMVRLFRLYRASKEALARDDHEHFHTLGQQISQFADDGEILWQLFPLNASLLPYLSEKQGCSFLSRLQEAKQRILLTGDRSTTLKVTGWLMLAYAYAGQLHASSHACFEALALIREMGGHGIWAGMVFDELVSILLLWNRLEEIPALIQDMIQIGTRWQHLDLSVRGFWRSVEYALAVGDLSGAHGLLQDLERLQQEKGAGNGTAWTTQLRVSYWLAASDLTSASAWAAHIVVPEEDWKPRDRFVLLLLAEVYCVQGEYFRAVELLNRLLVFLEQLGDRLRSIDALALSFMALHHAGKEEQACQIATRLFALTEPERLLRVYLARGEPMRQALQALLDMQIPDAGFSRSYVSTLLAAFEQEQHKRVQQVAMLLPTQAEAGTPVRTQPGLVEPLTKREQDVLRRLSEGASNQQIADALVIQLSTVKKHVSSLLVKLGAESRTQAIARARAASLLS